MNRIDFFKTGLAFLCGIVAAPKLLMSGHKSNTVNALDTEGNVICSSGAESWVVHNENTLDDVLLSAWNDPNNWTYAHDKENGRHNFTLGFRYTLKPYPAGAENQKAVSI